MLVMWEVSSSAALFFRMDILCSQHSIAILHLDVPRVRVSATWVVACSHALSASSTSQTRPGARAHGTTASFPQENCSFPLAIPSPFLLGRSLLKGPCSQRMDQGASTADVTPYRPSWLATSRAHSGADSVSQFPRLPLRLPAWRCAAAPWRRSSPFRGGGLRHGVAAQRYA